MITNKIAISDRSTLSAPLRTATLRCGMRVVVQQCAAPSVCCGIELLAGSRQETTAEQGLAHFLEHMGFKGTACRRPWQIIQYLESVGGSLDAYTTKEETAYYASVPTAYTARAVDLLVDLVFHSVYPEREMDKEREVVCDEIESYHDSPYDLVYDDFENHLFGTHPLGHAVLGSAETVRSFTRQQALHFVERWYKPSRAVFFLLGNVSLERVVRLLERATADLPTAQPWLPWEHASPQPVSMVAPPSLTLRRGTHQAHVMMGGLTFPSTDARWPALHLMVQLLGGAGMNARLNLSLRERSALVYTVECGSTHYADTGHWYIYFGCDHHDVKRCLSKVSRELARLVQQPLTPRQLRAAVRQRTGQLSMQEERGDNYALAMGREFLWRGTHTTAQIRCQQMEQVTAEQIQQLAASLFDSSHLTLLRYE